MSNYAIELRNITKTFGSVVANKNVNLTLEQGEILSLLGENGSGKTTLMNMLSGIYKPNAGQIFVNGQEVVIQSPEDSKKLGIGMVHQHFKLVDIFSCADNIWMGVDTPTYNLKEKLHNVALENNTFKAKFNRFGKQLGLVFKAMGYHIANAFLAPSRNKKIKSIIEKFGFDIDPDKKVYEMSVSEKQSLEIVKVLYYGAKTIILDEPTAVLTLQEIQKLFAILKKMKEDGHSIIIITHKLNEVKEISDRVAIMRKGEYIDTVDTQSTSIQQLTDLMVGKKMNLQINRVQSQIAGPLLEIRDLSIKNDEGAVAIDNVNFYIRSGEILGVAGIAGCGQKELCEAIAGLRHIESGMINHKGESIVGLSPKAIIAKGISMSFIPEDRLGMGLAPSLSIADNVILKDYMGDKWYNPFVNRKIARERATRIVKELEVVTPSIDTPVRRLSGGNVQKVLLGREIDGDPNVIVTAYPVRGLDINSSYAIYDILNKEKQKGTGILFVGEDLDVLLALCDKIMVLCHGKVMGVVHAEKTTKEELGLMMTGSLDLGESKHKNYGIASDSNIVEPTNEQVTDSVEGGGNDPQ